LKSQTPSDYLSLYDNVYIVVLQLIRFIYTYQTIAPKPITNKQAGKWPNRLQQQNHQT
jgi:hypothetical protein